MMATSGTVRRTMNIRRTDPNAHVGMMKIILGTNAMKLSCRIQTRIKKNIVTEADSEGIRDIARREGMVTLRENAIKKLLNGVTTYQEVLRVTWESL